MNSIDASVIILTKNAGANFRPLLERIFSQRFSGGFEVLVVDSGSTDDTLTIAAGFPVKVTRIEPEEFHHGRTRNLGAQLSLGRILIYITQDALPADDGWLQTLVDAFADGSVAMIVGRQIARPTTKPPERFFYVYNFPEHRIRIEAGADDYYNDNIFISNVNSAISKEVWQQFRFSEEVLMAEDKELACRLLNAGRAIVYEPGAVVYHSHDLSLREAFRNSSHFGAALAQGAGDLPRSRHGFRRRIRCLIAETRYVAHSPGGWKWLPYSAAYEAAKVLGQTVGRLRGRSQPKV
jgi:rhamnosyltransferase